MAYDDNKERSEAYNAGVRARQSLQSALEALDGARRWGVWDMLGGGFIATLVKHSKMEKASGYIEAAKRDLKAFSQELGEVQGFADVNVTTGDFWGFADWFYDGLFADWVVQNRINDARNQVQAALNKVNEILGEINSELR